MHAYMYIWAGSTVDHFMQRCATALAKTGPPAE